MQEKRERSEIYPCSVSFDYLFLQIQPIFWLQFFSDQDSDQDNLFASLGFQAQGWLTAFCYYKFDCVSPL